MKNFLAVSDKKLPEELDALSKSELVEETVQLTKKARQGQNASPAVLAIGAGVGLGLNEAINQGLKAYASSDLPLADTLADYFPWLRTVPSALAGVAMLLGSMKFDSKVQGGMFGAGLAVVLVAIVRIVDHLSHQGDLDAEQEQMLRSEIEDLKREKAARESGKKE